MRRKASIRYLLSFRGGAYIWVTNLNPEWAHAAWCIAQKSQALLLKDLQDETTNMKDGQEAILAILLLELKKMFESRNYHSDQLVRSALHRIVHAYLNRTPHNHNGAWTGQNNCRPSRAPENCRLLHSDEIDINSTQAERDNHESIKGGKTPQRGKAQIFCTFLDYYMAASWLVDLW